MEKIKIEFSSDDFIRGANKADLLDDGDFYAEYVEVDVEGVDLDTPVESFTAVGEWRRYSEDGHVAVPGILTVHQADFGENAPTYRDVLEGKISAGRIFKSGWEEWIIEAAE